MTPRFTTLSTALSPNTKTEPFSAKFRKIYNKRFKRNLERERERERERDFKESQSFATESNES